MKVTLISYTSEPMMNMAKAASVCYDTEPKRSVVEHCIKSGHDSITEFATFHFLVEGISRACSHQLVRHRLASYAQRSQRYCKEDGNEYITPPSINKLVGISAHYHNLMKSFWDAYDILLALDVPPEDARYILPNACSTTIHVQMNFRQLRHFCSQRLCSKAQWEIRQLAEKMREKVQEVEPKLGEYLVPKCESLGYCPEEE